jgi:cyclophilin family peptidyl-prolyl cis-trans isomerase
MTRRKRGSIVLGVGLAACAAGACEAPAPAGERPEEGLHAEIHTNRGTILVRLEPDLAPLATSSFVGLAEGTIANEAFEPGRPFYDGSPFHRVVPGHVIQAGIPDSPAASGPGYTFPSEVHAELSHGRAGILGVANGGPHTNSSQFYITLGDRSYLDGIYIVFGEVIGGMAVVHAVEQGDVVDSVRVLRSGTRARDFRPDTESFRAMVAEAEARVLEDEQERRRAEEEWIARNLPPLEGERGRVRIAPVPGVSEGSGRPLLHARYTGTALRFRGHLIGVEGPALVELSFGSAADGAPGHHDPPEWFPIEGEDEATLPDGLRGVLLEMEPGQRILAVVPAPLAYGRSGYFAPDRPGEPRFVIPPETMVVYEVEVAAR